MSDATRRTFLAAAGTGAATAAAVAVATRAGTGTPARASQAAAAAAAAGTFVAYVRDASAGTVEIFVGEHALVVQDSELVARLSAAAGR